MLHHRVSRKSSRLRHQLRAVHRTHPIVPKYIDDGQGAAHWAGLKRARHVRSHDGFESLLQPDADGLFSGNTANKACEQVKKAVCNIVQLVDFDIVEYAAVWRGAGPDDLASMFPDAEEYLTLSEDTPTLTVDKNMLPVVWYFPECLPPDAADSFRDEIEAVVRDCPDLLKRTGSDHKGKGDPTTHMGCGRAGTWTPVLGWHPQGLSYRKAPIPSAGLRRTKASENKRVTKFHEATKQHYQYLNSVFQVAEPRLYERYARTFTALRRLPSVKKLTSPWYSVTHGTSYIYNRATKRHRDMHGTFYGKERLVCVGRDLKGGALRIPVLGIRALYGHGSCIIFAGRLLEHEVEPFTGSRICAASFVHKSVMEWCGAPVNHVSLNRIPPSLRRSVHISTKRQLYY